MENSPTLQAIETLYRDLALDREWEQDLAESDHVEKLAAKLITLSENLLKPILGKYLLDPNLTEVWKAYCVKCSQAAEAKTGEERFLNLVKYVLGQPLSEEYMVWRLAPWAAAFGIERAEDLSHFPFRQKCWRIFCNYFSFGSQLAASDYAIRTLREMGVHYFLQLCLNDVHHLSDFPDPALRNKFPTHPRKEHAKRGVASFAERALPRVRNMAYRGLVVIACLQHEEADQHLIKLLELSNARQWREDVGEVISTHRPDLVRTVILQKFVEDRDWEHRGEYLKMFSNIAISPSVAKVLTETAEQEKDPKRLQQIMLVFIEWDDAENALLTAKWVVGALGHLKDAIQYLEPLKKLSGPGDGILIKSFHRPSARNIMAEWRSIMEWLSSLNIQPGYTMAQVFDWSDEFDDEAWKLTCLRLAANAGREEAADILNREIEGSIENVRIAVLKAVRDFKIISCLPAVEKLFDVPQLIPEVINKAILTLLILVIELSERDRRAGKAPNRKILERAIGFLVESLRGRRLSPNASSKALGLLQQFPKKEIRLFLDKYYECRYDAIHHHGPFIPLCTLIAKVREDRYIPWLIEVEKNQHGNLFNHRAAINTLIELSPESVSLNSHRHRTSLMHLLIQRALKNGNLEEIKFLRITKTKDEVTDKTKANNNNSTGNLDRVKLLIPKCTLRTNLDSSGKIPEMLTIELWIDRKVAKRMEWPVLHKELSKQQALLKILLSLPGNMWPVDDDLIFKLYNEELKLHMSDKSWEEKKYKTMKIYYKRFKSLVKNTQESFERHGIPKEIIKISRADNGEGMCCQVPVEKIEPLGGGRKIIHSDAFQKVKQNNNQKDKEIIDEEWRRPYSEIEGENGNYDAEGDIQAGGSESNEEKGGGGNGQTQPRIIRRTRQVTDSSGNPKK